MSDLTDLMGVGFPPQQAAMIIRFRDGDATLADLLAVGVPPQLALAMAQGGSPPPALTATLTGPTSGTTGVDSSAFAITLSVPATELITFTPSGTVGMVTFTPPNPTIDVGETGVTFTADPDIDGTHVISMVNDRGITNIGTVNYSTTSLQLTATFHADVADFHIDNWAGGYVPDMAWESTWKAPQFNYIRSIGYVGFHHPDSDETDTSARILTPTGPDTAVDDYVSTWAQFTDSSHTTPLVPPNNTTGYNADTSMDDNSPSLFFAQTNSITYSHHHVVDCSTGDVVAGIRYPQTVLPSDYTLADSTFNNNGFFNPALCQCIERGWVISLGVGLEGGFATRENADTLRIFKPTGNPSAPWSCLDSTYLLDNNADFQPPFSSRNDCDVVIRASDGHAILYVGGGVSSAWDAMPIFLEASDNTFHRSAHGYEDGVAMAFEGGGTLPTGVVAGHRYYVVADGLTDNDFRISETRGGSPLTFPDVVGTILCNTTNSRLMAIDLDAVDNGDINTGTTVSKRYANGNSLATNSAPNGGPYNNFTAMCRDELREGLFVLGETLSYYDIASDTWYDVDVASFPSGGGVYCQLKHIPKYHCLVGRMTNMTDSFGGASSRKWFTIELPVDKTLFPEWPGPIKLGVNTDAASIDSLLFYRWDNMYGDFRNYSGTPGVPGTYQDLSAPYGGTISVLASDPDGTVYSSDVTDMMLELTNSPTFAITMRVNGGDDYRQIFARSDYVPGVTKPYAGPVTYPQLVITTDSGTSTLYPDIDWDFSAIPENPGIWVTVGAFHFVWPLDLVVADIVSAIFKFQKVATVGGDENVGAYILAPHPVCFAPDSSEWGYSKVTTTTAPLDWKFDFPFTSAEMPAAGATAGYVESLGIPSHWGDDPNTFNGITNQGPSCQADSIGGMYCTVFAEGSKTNAGHTGIGDGPYKPLGDLAALEGVGTYGICFPTAISETDAMKLPSVEFFSVISGGAVVMMRMSQGSSQNPQYVGIMGQIYQQGVSGEVHEFNVHKMLALRSLNVQYMMKIYVKRGDVGMDNGEAKYVVDDVLMGTVTGQRYCIDETSVIAAHRPQIYYGGPNTSTADLVFRFNNFTFRAGPDWPDNSLFTWGPSTP